MAYGRKEFLEVKKAYEYVKAERKKLIRLHNRKGLDFYIYDYVQACTGFSRQYCQRVISILNFKNRYLIDRLYSEDPENTINAVYKDFKIMKAKLKEEREKESLDDHLHDEVVTPEPEPIANIEDDDENEFIPPDFYPEESIIDNYPEFDMDEYIENHWKKIIENAKVLRNLVKIGMKYYDKTDIKEKEQIFKILKDIYRMKPVKPEN